MGSAVQRAFLKINDAVLSGGDDLAAFAKVANMSAQEFKTAWQDDAAHALIPFLEGLNKTHEAGGNVNQILRDLGVTSVNELNTLLVLAGGYDQLAGNLELASGAYHETEEAMMALNKEAELAYGSTLGKLRTAWNRLKDSLIDIGEPIADAVIDIVDGAEPLFEWIEDLANGFSNLEKSAQQDIIKMVGQIALIAPALSIAGRAMTAVGNIGELTSKGVRLFGKGITLAFTDVGKSATELTTVAGTAAGSKGVGGLITSLAGSAGLPWALGIAAVALGGWTLWKTWGEDAWEAGERTRKWGTDVDESVESVLTSIQKTDGKFGLMASGVDVGAESMVESFQKVGSSIETDLINRLAITEEYLAGLPEVLRASQAEIFEESMTQQQESIALIEQNNAEILAIEEKALAERGKLNEVEMAAINMIHQDSVDAYITALQLGADEERSLRSALSGDVKEMGRETAQDLLVNLGEANRQLDDEMRSTLSDLKISYEEGAISAKDYELAVADVERYYEALGVTGKRTMRDIVSEYDDLIYSVNLATGEIISAHDRTAMGEERYQEIVRNNIAIVEQYGEAQQKSASEAADAVDWLVDRGRVGAETWNSIVIDSGGNMDVFREKVMETAQTAEGWNHIRFQIHEANLDSNAKLIIGEAAIQNGYWDGMAWEDKQAILKDNFSETVYKAIEDEGTWDNLSWEEQTAVLNNSFSDAVAQAIMDEGKWDDLPWEQKKAVLTTNSPETLQQILEDIGVWNTLPISVRNLIVNNNQVYEAVNNAQRKINSLRGTEVTVRTRFQSVYETINRAGSSASSQRFAQSGGTLRYDARGTDFHPGGLSVVNDQQGATFRELVTLPDGSSFIPKGRDVLLDLPKGSKVLRAALTKMKFPDIKQYQDGVGYSRRETQQIMANNSTDMSQTNNLLITLIDMVRSGQVIQMDGNEVGRTIYSTIDGTMTRNMQRNQIMNMQGG